MFLWHVVIANYKYTLFSTLYAFMEIAVKIRNSFDKKIFFIDCMMDGIACDRHQMLRTSTSC